MRLAIEDFETGYSLLYYLKRFPVDQLKVNCSFVEGLREDPEDVVFVSRINRFLAAAPGVYLSLFSGRALFRLNPIESWEEVL